MQGKQFKWFLTRNNRFLRVLHISARPVLMRLDVYFYPYTYAASTWINC
jgi:hypothetical protein